MKGQESREDPRRRIPPVDQVLGSAPLCDLMELYGRDLVRVQVQRQLSALRRSLADEGSPAASRAEALESALTALPEAVRRDLEAGVGAAPRRVLNATGILLHTNLGRAPMPAAVARDLPPLLDASCDLEMDLESGRRGDRNHRVEGLLKALTGAQGALVVNNNAAALVLVLAAFAVGKEVLVSRGELVEIGGSFRIPDILAAAGARLVEVGTTNRTRRRDYLDALSDSTALLLKVFPSNYRIGGFTESVSPQALAEISQSHGVPLLVDEGSGLLQGHSSSQLRDHPSFTELVEAGCDLVCGSGDKLVGGPQAGLLVGRGELIRACRRHPLYRALRPGRGVLATLDAVLRRHLRGAEGPLERLWPGSLAHRRRLEAFQARLGAQAGEIVEAEAFLGGGSAPERGIPGKVLTWPGGDALLTRLRNGTPAVVGYLREGRLYLDLRTVDPADDGAVAEALCAALGSGAPAESLDG